MQMAHETPDFGMCFGKGMGNELLMRNGVHINLLAELEGRGVAAISDAGVFGKVYRMVLVFEGEMVEKLQALMANPFPEYEIDLGGNDRMVRTPGFHGRICDVLFRFGKLENNGYCDYVPLLVEDIRPTILLPDAPMKN